jgi:hypothetical protein
MAAAAVAAGAVERQAAGRFGVRAYAICRSYVASREARRSNVTQQRHLPRPDHQTTPRCQLMMIDRVAPCLQA